MARLVLVGLPATGKTTVARAVGERLGCEAVDTDEVLASMVAESAPDHLRAVGEAQFRLDEVAALSACVAGEVVVSTGGGIVESQVARSILMTQVTVWLDAGDDVLVARAGHGDRPLLGGDARSALVALRARRSGWYREVSRAVVDASRPVEEVVDLVVRAMMAP